MKNITVTSLKYLVVVALAYSIAPDLSAARVDYNLGVEAMHTDNSTLSSNNEQSDVRTGLIAGMQLSERSARITGDLQADITAYDYRNDTFPNEVIGSLDGNFEWVIRPSSVIWHLQDQYTQQRLNYLLPSTPDNLVNTNIFSTGPDLFFRVNSVNRILFGLRGEDYRYDQTAQDNQRSAVNLSWLYDVSHDVELSLNLSYQQAKYDEVDDADYDRGDLFLGINSTYGRNHLNLELGTSSIKRAAYSDVSGYLVRVTWRNQFREQSYFLLEASSQYTDSGLNLLTYGSLDPLLSELNGDIFYDRRAIMTYRLVSGPSATELRVFLQDEDYEVVPQDRRITGAQLLNNYSYSPTVTFVTGLTYRKNDNYEVDQVDEERLATISIDYRVSRAYTWHLEFNRSEQESTEPTFTYDENRVILRFSYDRL